MTDQQILGQVINICSSGGIGELTDSAWRVRELTNLFQTLTQQQKDQLWKGLEEHINVSDGWYVNDVKFLKEELNQKSEEK